MAMNNVAYRARGWLGDDYSQVRMGLRMNVISKPGIEKADFELFSLAVSTINGCEHCTVAHEKTVREEGLTKEQVFEAVKIAATVSGVAQALQIADAS
jgi:alkyl hydroperoxide reductase subunit D